MGLERNYAVTLSGNTTALTSAFKQAGNSAAELAERVEVAKARLENAQKSVHSAALAYDKFSSAQKDAAAAVSAYGKGVAGLQDAQKNIASQAEYQTKRNTALEHSYDSLTKHIELARQAVEQLNSQKSDQSSQVGVLEERAHRQAEYVKQVAHAYENAGVFLEAYEEKHRRITAAISDTEHQLRQLSSLGDSGGGLARSEEIAVKKTELAELRAALADTNQAILMFGEQRTRLGAVHDRWQQAESETAAALRVTRDELGQTNRELSEASNLESRLVAERRQVAKALDEGRDKVAQYADTLSALSDAEADYQAKQDSAYAAENKATEGIEKNSLAKLNAEERSTKMAALLEQEQYRLDTYSSKLHKNAEALNQYSMQLTIAGAAMAKLGHSVEKAVMSVGGSAMDWEQSMANVAKTVNGTDAEINQLEDSIRGLAKTMPLTHSELAEAAAMAGQLGVSIEHIEDFTRVAGMLGTATSMSAAEAANGLSQLMNIMGVSFAEAEHYADVLVNLGNNSATTEGQILSMAQRIAGAGKIVGMTGDQVMAIAAGFLSVGVKAEAGGTAVTTVLTRIGLDLAAGGEEAQRWVDVTNGAFSSVAELQQAWATDSAGVFMSVIRGLHELGAAGENLFSVMDDMSVNGVRVYDVLMRGAGAADMIEDKFGFAANAAGAATADFDRFANTAKNKWGTATNNAKDALINFGQIALPVVDLASRALTTLSRAFNSLSPEMKTLGTAGAALVGGFLLIGGGALALISQIAAANVAFASAAATTTGMAQSFMAAGAATTKLALSFSALLLSLAPIVVGVAAVTASLWFLGDAAKTAFGHQTIAADAKQIGSVLAGLSTDATEAKVALDELFKFKVDEGWGPALQLEGLADAFERADQEGKWYNFAAKMGNFFGITGSMADDFAARVELADQAIVQLVQEGKFDEAINAYQHLSRELYDAGARTEQVEGQFLSNGTAAYLNAVAVKQLGVAAYEATEGMSAAEITSYSLAHGLNTSQQQALLTAQGMDNLDANILRATMNMSKAEIASYGVAIGLNSSQIAAYQAAASYEAVEGSVAHLQLSLDSLKDGFLTVAGTVHDAWEAAMDLAKEKAEALAERAGKGANWESFFETASVRDWTNEILSATADLADFQDNILGVRQRIIAELSGEAQSQAINALDEAVANGNTKGVAALMNSSEQDFSDWADAQVIRAEILNRDIQSAFADQDNVFKQNYDSWIESVTGDDITPIVNPDIDPEGKVEYFRKRAEDPITPLVNPDTSLLPGMRRAMEAQLGAPIRVSIVGNFTQPATIPALFSGKMAARATGGAIYGGVAGRDSVPALLMPGEHVLTVADVAALGGQSGVYAFREALGNPVARFADGGSVGGYEYGRGSQVRSMISPAREETKQQIAAIKANTAASKANTKGQGKLTEAQTKAKEAETKAAEAIVNAMQDLTSGKFDTFNESVDFSGIGVDTSQLTTYLDMVNTARAQDAADKAKAEGLIGAHKVAQIAAIKAVEVAAKASYEARKKAAEELYDLEVKAADDVFEAAKKKADDEYEHTQKLLDLQKTNLLAAIQAAQEAHDKLAGSIAKAAEATSSGVGAWKKAWNEAELIAKGAARAAETIGLAWDDAFRPPSMADWLLAMQEQAAAFATFKALTETAMGQVKSELPKDMAIAAEAMLQELIDLGPDGHDALRLFVEASAGERKKLVEAWMGTGSYLGEDFGSGLANQSVTVAAAWDEYTRLQQLALEKHTVNVSDAFEAQRLVVEESYTKQLTMAGAHRDGLIAAAQKVRDDAIAAAVAKRDGEINAAKTAYDTITNQAGALRSRLVAEAEAAKNAITDKFNQAARNAAGALGGIKSALDSIPSQKTITITTVHETVEAVRRVNYGGGSGGQFGGYMQAMASGGLVPGISPSNPREDNVLAMIRSGEFVQSQPAVDYYGPGFMAAINNRAIPKEFLPRYAGGGQVGRGTPIPAQALNYTLTVDGGGQGNTIQFFNEINYPVAEPVSVAQNKALDHFAAVGII